MEFKRGSGADPATLAWPSIKRRIVQRSGCRLDYKRILDLPSPAKKHRIFKRGCGLDYERILDLQSCAEKRRVP